MENLTVVVECLILIITALGGFRQYILKPYWETREKERKWQEEVDKAKEDKRKERDRRIEALEKAKEERQEEREKRVEEKYEQLSNSITKLTDVVTIMQKVHQKDALEMAGMKIKQDTMAKDLEELWTSQHDLCKFVRESTGE
jgi:hypothetical protein